MPRNNSCLNSLGDFDVITGPTVTCPVCHEVLSLDSAAEHDHLRTVDGERDDEPEPTPVGGGGRGRLARARVSSACSTTPPPR